VSKSIGKVGTQAVIEEWNDLMEIGIPFFKAVGEIEYKGFKAEFESRHQESSTPATTNLRTCTVSLNKILRELPTVADQDHFRQKLDHAAREATNYVADLASYTRAVMLDTVQQGFTIIVDDDDSVQVKKGSDVSSLPNIDDFLPLATQRNLDFIPRNHIISIAPPPKEHTEKLKGHDLTKMFQLDHIQYLHTKYLTSKNKKGKKTWDELSPSINRTVQLTKGYYYTRQQALCTFSTNLANIWSGNIFGRCLDRLLLVYLRVHLAPEREGAHMELVSKLSKDAKERKAKQVKKRSGTRQILRRETRYLTKCLKRESQDQISDSDRENWQRRAQSCHRRRATLYAEHQRRKNLLTTSNVPPVDETQDGEADIDQTAISNAEHALEMGEEEGYVTEILEEATESDDETEPEDEAEPMDDAEPKDTTVSKAKKDKKEISSKRIFALKTLAKKMLLSDDTVEDNIQQQIRSAWKQKTELSEKEMNIVEQCIKLLKPYMPSQKAPRCIMLHLPLVMLSNTIQRVAGYGNFTREICPHISPASIQALPVDCRVMYEVLSSSVHSDPFTIRDRENILISSVNITTNFKQETLGSFFDLQRLNEICSHHGLIFDNRLTYLPNGLVRLQGTLTPDVRPSLSHYDLRKHQQSSNRRQSVAKRVKDDNAEVKRLISDVDSEISELTNKQKANMKKINFMTKKVKKLKEIAKASQADGRLLAYDDVRSAKNIRAELRLQDLRWKVELRVARRKKWRITNVSVVSFYTNCFHFTHNHRTG
jgi:hypothetical protein